MKRIIFGFLLLCLICSGCGKKQEKIDTLGQIEQRGKIIVGVRDDVMPFGYRDLKGNFVGYDIDLAKIIAKEILGSEQKIEFVPVTASNRIMKLNSGEVDMLIATMSITEQRQQILDFSTPYYIAGQAIMVKKSSKATRLKDFEGKKLIIVFGSTSERNLRTNVPEVEVLGFKNYNEAFNALKAGKAEGITADDTILYNFALKDNSVTILPKRYSQEPYAVAFRKEKESNRLLKKTDFIIENLQTSHKLDRLREKWNINKGR
jgi:putative glutamine transport system substrate-binding protein